MLCWSGFGKAVSLLVLSSRDLDDLGLQLVYPTPYSTLTALTALARSSLATKASYSTSLLVIGKLRWTIHSILSLSGERSTTSTPPTCLLDDLSVCILHRGYSSATLSSLLVNSAMSQWWPVPWWQYTGGTECQTHSTLLPIVLTDQQLPGCSLPIIRACRLGRSPCGFKSMV